MSSSAAAALKALAYADIFDYPLTAKEIYHWAIGKLPLDLSLRHPQIKSLGGYYFLKGRQSLVRLRQSRLRFSRQKLHLARTVGNWLKLIPTIKLVAVTGALAMNNSDKADDIDLIIITSENTLWFTRLLVVPLVSLIATRRTPTRNSTNAICLNLWLDTTALAVPKPKRNLYTAHEVAQIKLLWSRADTYQQFLSANSWINQFLPNIKVKGDYSQQPHPRVIPLILEQLTYQLQLWYMKSKITREKVTSHSAFFHPRDTSGQVMRQYNRQLNQLKLKP